MDKNDQRRSGVSVKVLLPAVLALAGFWLAGCRTTVYQQGDQAAGSAQTAAMEIQTQSQTLEATLARVNDLVDKPAADLKPQFLMFSSALDRLIKATERGGVTGRHLVRSNTGYIAAWNTQLGAITNADVRSHSETRKTEVANHFNAASQYYASAQEALGSLVDYLRDMRKALGADLTAGGVQAVKPLVSAASTQANTVQSSLTQARTDLMALSTAMSSATRPSGD